MARPRPVCANPASIKDQGKAHSQPRSKMIITVVAWNGLSWVSGVRLTLHTYVGEIWHLVSLELRAPRRWILISCRAGGEVYAWYDGVDMWVGSWVVVGVSQVTGAVGRGH